MSGTSLETYNKSRIDALSDGLFAIILTLLVLELKAPTMPGNLHDDPSELAHQLFDLLPKFLSWIISYVVLVIIWQNHHRLFAMFDKITKKLYWANALFLMFASFIPFPTALWGEYPKNPLAVSFYGITMIAVTVGFLAIRKCIHDDPSILKSEFSLDDFKYASKQVLIFGCGSYLVGAVLAWFSPILAALVYVGISVNFFFSARGR